ncbi:cyclic pyranopterin monophosphate synthase MoaC [Tsukamurella sp. PLM1]|uniref:cyclic pyranopterin monophosphate synthase MoaC n=1 Tax=Tsukamurella sp. PLM1 TaxID=2929795 RepID=UPI00205AB64A|nr:cyclic pyranopterin monophosphate synthase MoaC [Tsukamurella sp. PLM1]BDH55828.1 cyclic pyranopterin monophosphate synthase accessory protein 2 [Tsukamurella sp. PLM1]
MGLTHVDDAGAARMVDVSDKAVTARTAVAAGTFRTTEAVIAAIADGAVPKGDVLATARIAGIMAVKRTSDLIPLCHPLPISGVQVDLEPSGAEIAITATVRCTGRTGVEMEALTAVSVAGLTLHDMVKALDPAAVMTDVRVLAKEGGKTGRWSRDD